jgi:hypothetical protein
VSPNKAFFSFLLPTLVVSDIHPVMATSQALYGMSAASGHLLIFSSGQAYQSRTAAPPMMSKTLTMLIWDYHGV